MIRSFALCPLALAVALCVGACRSSPKEAKRALAPPQEEPVFRVLQVHVPGSLRAGDSIVLRPQEVGVYSDPATWARMSVTWEPGTDGGLTGKLGTGEKLELGEDDGRAVMRENGQVLCDLERLRGPAADEVRKTILAKPDLPSMRKQVVECFASFDSTLPDAHTFAGTNPENFHTTASARNVLFLAQALLAEACKPIPARCLVPDLMQEQEARLAAAAAKCAQK